MVVYYWFSVVVGLGMLTLIAASFTGRQLPARLIITIVDGLFVKLPDIFFMLYMLAVIIGAIWYPSVPTAFMVALPFLMSVYTRHRVYRYLADE